MARQPTHNTADTTASQVRLAYGSVVNVRSIPTRSVTRIEVEIPIEAHVEATRILFGQDVLVMPARLPGTYGMTTGLVPDVEPAPSQEMTPEPEADAQPPSRLAASQVARSAQGGIGPRLHEVDIIRWLGARCREDHFQDWLGARTEAGAIERVRQLCGVESRSHIPQTQAARQAFFSQIYTPYRSHLDTSDPRA
jgi:hypothetical protein